MKSTAPTHAFPSLNAAIDSLDPAYVAGEAQGALEDLETAETVESIDDLEANLRSAQEQLEAALKRIKSVRARLAVTPRD